MLTYTYTNTGPGAWNYSVTIPAAYVGGTCNPVQVTNGSLTFDSNGNLTLPTANVTGISIGPPATAAFADGASNLNFTWQLYNGSSSLVTQVAAPSSTTAANQDGSGSGSLVDFSIGSDGTISGSFSNGKTLPGNWFWPASRTMTVCNSRATPTTRQLWPLDKPYSGYPMPAAAEASPEERWSCRMSTSPPSSPT